MAVIVLSYTLVTVISTLFAIALTLYVLADNRNKPRLAVIAIALWIVAGVCVGWIRAAPAPLPKPMPPPALVAGSTIMTWVGTDAETHFHSSGDYYCLWHGRWWWGVWECKGGILTVREAPHGTGLPVSPSWTVRLKCPQSGTLFSGSPWKVRPLAGKVY